MSNKWMVLSAWAIGVAGLAAPRTAVVATGDCRDPDLINSMRTFAETIRAKQPDQILDEDSFVEKIGPPSSKSVEDLKRQLESGRDEFYNRSNQRARDLIHSAQRELQRLPPGGARWALWAFSHELEGLILKESKHLADSDDEARTILRVDPNAQLDADLYPPEYRARWERVRKELAKKEHLRLNVKSTPSNADVFLDGKLVGKTPFSTVLPPAVYQVIVGREGKFSFPLRVDPREKEGNVSIDLALESSINADRVPCLNDSGDERSQVDKATHLLTRLDVQEMVIIRLERHSAGPSWLSATLMNGGGGQRVRSGGLNQERGRAPQGIADLVDYIITGKEAGNVRAEPSGQPVAVAQPAQPKASPPPKPIARREVLPMPPPPPRLTPEPKAVENPQTAPDLTTSLAPASRGAPPGAIAMASVGAAGLLAGGIFEVLTAVSWGQFNALFVADNGTGFKSSDLPQAATLRDQARGQQVVAIVGFAVGAAGLGAGWLLWKSAPAVEGGTKVSASLKVAPSQVGLSVAY